MSFSGIGHKRSGGESCRYMLCGECQLFSKNINEDDVNIMPEYAERLLHMTGCQEEIIALQKEVIDDLFVIVAQHLSVDCEEVRAVTAKINEAATMRADYHL